MLGDLNDEPAAATTQILYGPPGSQLDTPGFAHPDRGDGLRLWNLANRIPADQRFTRIFEGHGKLIDHILVSHTLLDPLPTVEVIRQTGQDQLPSISTDAAARRAQPASDHAAVLAHLQAVTAWREPPDVGSGRDRSGHLGVDRGSADVDHPPADRRTRPKVLRQSLR